MVRQLQDATQLEFAFDEAGGPEAALDRIRARPAYARLGEPGRDIESLKTEF